jgi:hypothetical protein
MVVVARVEVPVARKVPATVRRLLGDEEPRPRFPALVSVRRLVPVDEAILRRLVFPA